MKSKVKRILYDAKVIIIIKLRKPNTDISR